MASSYGWAALVAFVLAILITLILWIQRGKKDAVQAARSAAEAIDAARKVKEHEQVAEVERRPLPGGVVGGGVRDVDKPLGN